MSKRHQLWLNLSSTATLMGGDGGGGSNIFDLLRKMLYSDISVVSTSGGGIPESFRIVFPSDKQWQNKIYLQLVAKQRKHDAALKELQQQQQDGGVE